MPATSPTSSADTFSPIDSLDDATPRAGGWPARLLSGEESSVSRQRAVQFTLRRLALISGLAASAFALDPLAAAAQSSGQAPPQPAHAPARPARPTGWVFEVHIGSIVGGAPSKILVSQLPPQGPSF